MKKERVSVIFFSHARSNFLFNIFWLASYPVYGAKREKFLDIGFNPFMHFFWVANCNFIQGPVWESVWICLSFSRSTINFLFLLEQAGNLHRNGSNTRKIGHLLVIQNLSIHVAHVNKFHKRQAKNVFHTKHCVSLVLANLLSLWILTSRFFLTNWFIIVSLNAVPRFSFLSLLLLIEITT